MKIPKGGNQKLLIDEEQTNEEQINEEQINEEQTNEEQTNEEQINEEQIIFFLRLRQYHFHWSVPRPLGSLYIQILPSISVTII